MQHNISTTTTRNTSTSAAYNMLQSILQNVWNELGIKAINKQIPHRLTHQSVGMIHQFSRMVSKNKVNSGAVKNISDHPQTFKQNYILGTTKFVQKSHRSYSQRASDQISIARQSQESKQSKHKIKTVRTKTQKNIKIKQEKEPQPIRSRITTKNTVKPHLFQLPSSHQNTQQDKIDEYYRNTLASDMQYQLELQQQRRRLQQARQQRKQHEAKRLKQMKEYTYDFQGKLISKVEQKPGQLLKVLKMKPQLTQQQKLRSISSSRKGSKSKISSIYDKKLITLQKTPVLDIIAQKAKKKRQLQQQQQLQKRKTSYNKYVSINKFANLFNKNTRISVGISITNVDDQENVKNEHRKSQTREFNLSQFKDYQKHQQIVRSRNVKLRKNATTYHKTQGDQFLYQDGRNRVKTQGAERTNRVSQFGKSRNTGKTGRGTIHINHQKLYSQNFSPQKSQL